VYFNVNVTIYNGDQIDELYFKGFSFMNEALAFLASLFPQLHEDGGSDVYRILSFENKFITITATIFSKDHIQ